MNATFSIVIPTYGRPRAIATCLASLAELDYPREAYEVIVVDDGGRISLEPIVEPLRQRMDITLLCQKNAGPATARNTGTAQAKHSYIAFTDDDCQPAPDWLTRLAEQFEQTPHAAVGGHVINILRNDLYATTSQALIDYLYDYYNPDPNKATFLTSNNFALSKALFIEAGGFDATYRRAAAEDREFCERWLLQGRQMVYQPKALVRHSHHMSIKRFWKQHFNYGRGAFRFHQLRARRGHQPIRVEPTSFYFDLLTYPHRHQLPRAIDIAVLLWISQAANALGFFREKYFGDEKLNPSPEEAGRASPDRKEEKAEPGTLAPDR